MGGVIRMRKEISTVPYNVGKGVTNFCSCDGTSKFCLNLQMHYPFHNDEPFGFQSPVVNYFKD